MSSLRNVRGSIFFTFLIALELALQAPFAQTVDSIPPLTPQSRIVILPPAEPISDPRLLDALAQIRGGKRDRPRPKNAPKRGTDRFTKLQTGKTKPPPPPPLLTRAQLGTISRVLFRETLVERLRTGGKFAIVSDDAAQSVLKTLPPQRSRGELTPARAALLAEKLQADAVLNIEGVLLTLPGTADYAGDKETVLRVVLRVYGPHLTTETVVEKPSSILQSQTFLACGAAEKNVALFGKRPSRIGVQGTGRAARQAALRAAHTLRTGEILPLSLPGGRLALAPVASPSAADQMIFAASGRSVRKAAVRDLPAEVSGLFTPDLSPLPEASVVPAYRMRNVLLKFGLPITALWKNEDEPQIALARKAARELGANYVLMATISDLDVDTGKETGDKPVTWLTEGRAEAVGVLFRVSDGKVLWQDSAALNLSNRASQSKMFSLLRQEQTVSRDTVQFALLELQRRFHRYVSGFEN